MDTQLKKTRYSLGFKITAWIVCIVGMCVAAWAATDLFDNGWAEGDYLSSSGYENSMQRSLDNVYRAFYGDQSSMQATITNVTSDLESERMDRISSLAQGSSQDTAALIDAVNKLYDQKVQDAKNSVIQEYTEEQSQSKSALDSRKDLLYAVEENGNILYTNVSGEDPLAYLKSLTTFTQETNYQIDAGPVATAAEETVSGATDEKPSVSTVQPSYEGTLGKTVTVSAAMPQDVFEQNQTQYLNMAQKNGQLIWWLVAGLSTFAAGFAWLMYAAGRKPTGGEVQVGWSDGIPLDVGFLLMIGTLFISVALVAGPSDINPGSYFSTVYICIMAAMAVSAWNMWFISLAKRIKRGDSGQYTAFYMLFGRLHKLYRESGATAKIIWLAVLWMLCALVSAGLFVAGFYIYSELASIIGFILMLVFAGLLFRFLYQKTAAVNRIIQGLKWIQEGNLDYTIAPAGGPELEKIADGINHIADGFHSAVKKEVRSERMKTELITNISHDLKTPLTSIIAYIDLLKKEELHGENAQKYLEVLELKSNRLKVLTEDLFEAAKASSGDIAVNMDKIELVQFMQQVLGEMSDKIQKSGLIFVNDIPDDKLYVCADGKLLWRVMGNVLDNVLKYALEGSRVYIDVKKTLKSILITVKNISRDALNIPEEELMERFRRGDVSRHTEGSGLGLSIARDLMQIMGCGFEIEIDGDLFKVIMRLNEA